MPIDYRRYPANWREISRQIRARAGDRCELCGAPNHAWIVREDGAATWRMASAEELAARAAGRKGPAVRIILTVAHWDHDHTNNDPGNLRALCQRCHLRHDRAQHAANSRRTRSRKRGQLVLFD